MFVTSFQLQPKGKGSFLARTAGSRNSFSHCGNSGGTVAKLENAALDRRQLLQGLLVAAVAVFAGKAQPAHSGSEPKMSFFGADAPSSPFSYNESQKEPLFKGITPELLEEYRLAISEAKKRIEDSGEAISTKSWEDVRSALRLALGTLRSVCSKVNAYAAAEATKQEKKKIEKAYRDFLKTIEDMDYAARMKDPDRAERLRTASIAALDNWMSTVGI
jgi:hypothetical protein